jgi:hypothetical protein
MGYEFGAVWSVVCGVYMVEVYIQYILQLQLSINWNGRSRGCWSVEWDDGIET